MINVQVRWSLLEKISTIPASLAHCTRPPFPYHHGTLAGQTPSPSTVSPTITNMKYMNTASAVSSLSFKHRWASTKIQQVKWNLAGHCNHINCHQDNEPPTYWRFVVFNDYLMMIESLHSSPPFHGILCDHNIWHPPTVFLVIVVINVTEPRQPVAWSKPHLDSYFRLLLPFIQL